MRFIIVGCGRMGAGLARVLSSRGHTITVVDEDRDAMERLKHSFRGKTIVGSGFGRGVLLEAGIERADGLAAVTDNDETNIVVARIARLVFQVPRVVARLYEPRKVEAYQKLGVQIVAPDSWGINRFADLLSYSELDTILSLGDGEVEIVEMEIPVLLVGRKVSAVTVPGEVHVVAVSRRGKAFLPTSETIFQKNDSLHIALLTASSERLRAILALT
ncbi:potassium channel family protein [Desulforhabdus amnigena]|jgi:trk system potassium uptake protein TrkA|uniref:Trk system potassium uptake protein TrkA n=1 Tax=Desulforhabdus amnigena TaxID=40218 RepID=A0A9W6FUF1_9BACT|nr:TrkA family potassium uptake protein [Desulforhabdus amnigena]NLJ27541.1 TrkA family potassium uptake protein [Deltaproteobacteria bacterium]GLI35062.1 potassium uptake protein TrkA [Desulforhabdus amnigena]